MLTKDGKPADADKILADFLNQQPDNVTLSLMRAQIQAESLHNMEQARSLLLASAEKTDNSAPLVQLAGLELDANRLEAAQAVIAKVRSRWKEAAAGDVLDAQLALKRGNVEKAIEFFDVALKKDPDNKIVQLYKAQLDGQTGAVTEATKSLEAIVKNKPIKEVDTGTTLMAAAQSALAGLSLRAGAFDDAIRRFEDLKRSDQNGTLTKADRWQLITAYVARGSWPQAKREIASLLNDPKNPPTDEERVRGANFYRQQGEDAPALAQIDYVLNVNPTNPAAVVTRSYILLKAKQYDQAAEILTKAVSLLEQKKEQPPAVFYVMLAAVENEKEPAKTALDRAIVVLDRGLVSRPDDLELVQAKYTALRAAARNADAIAFVEAKAKAFPQSQLKRELVKVYREQKRYDRAAEVLRELIKETPDDTNLAAALIQLVSIEADDAGARNDVDRHRELNNQASAMIKEYRGRFPNSQVFVQAESDMAARSGNITRAIDLTREIDKMSRTSPVGRTAASPALCEHRKDARTRRGLQGSPRSQPPPARRTHLPGPDQAQNGRRRRCAPAGELRTRHREKPARGTLAPGPRLAESGSTASEKDRNQQAAIARLTAMTKDTPRLEDAFHTLAEIQLKRNDRRAAVATLKDDIKANPGDAAALARLVEVLCQRGPGNTEPAVSDLEDAKRLAAEIAGSDKQGSMTLALAIGFHKASQHELALPYARTAATKLDTAAAHLNLGDVLLTLAENNSDTKKQRASLELAIAEYDRVLKKQPNSVEAINNKAWILHSYLDQSRQALELVLGLQKRVNPVALPGEFYDTLGSIQESIGQARDAEQTYMSGLKKAPENPVLNFHFGRMIAHDRDRDRAGRPSPISKRPSQAIGSTR